MHYQQLSLFSFLPSPLLPTPQLDPYWDAIERTENEREEYGVREQVLDSTSAGCKPNSSVREQVSTNTLKSAPEHVHWVERYYVRRCEKEHYYYRYCWMEGRKIRRVHIGSIHSAIAFKKYNAVAAAIEAKKSPPQIKQLINPSLGKGGKGS